MGLLSYEGEAGEERPGEGARVVSLVRDDAELLDKLRQGDTDAPAMLYDRFSRDVNRLVWRLLGADSEHGDLVQRVFLKLLQSVKRVRDPSGLAGFVRQVTVNTVRSEFRRRAVRRRFSFLGVEDPDSFPCQSEDHEARAALRTVIGVLEKLPVEERLVFTLRYVDSQSMDAVAQACGYSLSTAKRRLARAEKRFKELARRHPGLAERLRRGGRWGEA